MYYSKFTVLTDFSSDPGQSATRAYYTHTVIHCTVHTQCIIL